MDAAALAATRELLCEVGYADTTIDKIARRAQVSRTAIYRRWPSKALIVHEAVFPASDPRLHVASTGDLASDLRALVNGWVALLRPDAVCAITRDYLADPKTGRRAEWHIECLSPHPGPRREDDAELARRYQAALTWVREQSMLVLPLEDSNTVTEPYPVPARTMGWAAGDAAYAMGSFSLQPGEALVIAGRSPECAFWNLCLWNPFLHTYDYDRERVTINGHQVVYEDDGSWRIVIAATDPGHPNWVSTSGHAKGRIWFRWFLPATAPDPPVARVVPLSEAGAA